MQRVTPMRRLLIAATSVCMVATALVGANLAQANSVWVQSYERSSETAACDSPPEPLSEWRATWADPYDPISGPTWHPTWEQWANNGNGGWTCTRSVTWARNDGVTYRLGDIGPGGGLVFLISGGLTYEMAPKTWSGGTEDPGSVWCNVTDSNVAGATGLFIGDGSANTSAMLAACTSGAANAASAYRGGGFADWFLPSYDELNAMCNYSRNPESPGTVRYVCAGAQNAGFVTGAYGFEATSFWTSSQSTNTVAWDWDFSDPVIVGQSAKDISWRVRPIRAF